MSQMKLNKKLLGVIGLIIIVAAIASGAAVFSPKASSFTVATDTSSSISPSPSPIITPAPTSNPITSPQVRPNAVKSPTLNTSGYNDGTYSSNAGYDSPGGTEFIAVTLTLKNGVVTDSNVVTTGNNQTGKYYQANFVAGYKSQVVGRSIAGLNLSRVSGSSLTPNGFNDAVDKIKSQSKV